MKSFLLDTILSHCRSMLNSCRKSTSDMGIPALHSFLLRKLNYVSQSSTSNRRLYSPPHFQESCCMENTTIAYEKDPFFELDYLPPLEDAGSDVSGSSLLCSTKRATEASMQKIQRVFQSLGHFRILGNRGDCEQNLDITISSLFNRFFYEQAVVLGKPPPWLTKERVYVISMDERVQPFCCQVRCRQCPKEWPTALALKGFDWRESTVWLLPMQGTSDTNMLQQLKAVAMMSAPCSVVLLLSWSPMVSEVANEAGFSKDVVQYAKPLYVLRRKERHARCDETDSPYTSPPYSPPPEPALDGWVVQFGLNTNGMSQEVQNVLVRGCAKVVGSCQALGKWNVGLALRLEPVGGVLTADVLVKKDDHVEYKYVVEGKDGMVHWECGWNRSLPRVDDISIWLEEHWRG